MRRNSNFFELILGFVTGTRAAVLAYVAFAAPVMLGLGGLAVDVGYWHANNRDVQSIADSAAIAGALENVKERDTPQIEERVKFDAELNGAEISTMWGEIDGTAFTTTVTAGARDSIRIEHPPSISSLHAGNTSMVEVVVTRQVPSLLISRFVPNPTVSARAVAEGDILDSCIVSLAPDDGSGPSLAGVSTSGSAEVELECGIIANSVDNNALEMDGTSCVRVTQGLVKVVGDYDDNSSNADPTCHPDVLTGVNPFRDPLSYLQDPIEQGLWDGIACDYGTYTAGNGDNTDLSVLIPFPATPNVYVFCGHLRVTNGGKIVFPPDSVVILNSSGLRSTGTGQMVALNNTLVYLYNPDHNSDVIALNGGYTKMYGHSDGHYAGVLFVADPNAAVDTYSHSIQGGGNLDIQGIFYAPTGTVTLAGGGAGDNNRSLVISYRIQFTGNAVMGDFDGTVVGDNTNLIQSTLAE